MSTPILKTLQADPSKTIDLNSIKPEGLEDSAKEVWDYFAANTPFWWSTSDLMTVERYCFLLGTDRDLRYQMNQARKEQAHKRYLEMWGAMKSLSLEISKVEYSLGCNSQGRAALKLAYPADQKDRETPDESDDPIDPEEL